MSTWVLSCIAGALATLSVGSVNILLLSYPIFILLANGAVALAIILGRNKKKR